MSGLLSPSALSRARRPSSLFRPQLEVLEDRLVPSDVLNSFSLLTPPGPASTPVNGGAVSGPGVTSSPPPTSLSAVGSTIPATATATDSPGAAAQPAVPAAFGVSAGALVVLDAVETWSGDASYVLTVSMTTADTGSANNSAATPSGYFHIVVGTPPAPTHPVSSGDGAAATPITPVTVGTLAEPQAGPEKVSVAPPQTVSVTIAPVAGPQAPRQESGHASPPVAPAIPGPESAPVITAQLVAVSIAAGRPAESTGNFSAPSPATPGKGEAAVAVNWSPPGSVRVSSASSLPVSTPGQATGALAPMNPPQLIVAAGHPGAATAGAPEEGSPTIRPHNNAVPGGANAWRSGTTSLSLSGSLGPFVAGNENSSRAVGDQAAGLPQTAAQRKALAVGLRYLFPVMTDEEIARAVGVSRRSLFRWEEYRKVKQALRTMSNRPRGHKDRDGNLEAWTEEDE